MKIASFPLVAGVLLAAGDVAAQMAAAPRSNRQTPAPPAAPPTVDTPPPAVDAPPANRFIGFDAGEKGLFTAALFSAARADAQVYTNERTNVRTKKIANVRVECMRTGGYIHGSISAKQGPKDKTPIAAFTFKGTQFESSFTCEDPAIGAELEAAKRCIEARYKVWRKENAGSAVVTAAAGEASTLDDMTL